MDTKLVASQIAEAVVAREDEFSVAPNNCEILDDVLLRVIAEEVERAFPQIIEVPSTWTSEQIKAFQEMWNESYVHGAPLRFVPAHA